MALLQLPDATFPITPGATGDGALDNEPPVETLAGVGTIIPLLYGDVWPQGQLATAFSSSNNLVLLIVWGLGEVYGIDVFLNGEPPPSGVDIVSYTGRASQQPDPYLVEALSDVVQYEDSLVYEDPKYGRVGVAYSVVVIPAGTEGINGLPQVTAHIQGRIVYSPTHGERRYSDCPADILADFISDPIVGMRRTVNRRSHAALAAQNDEVMARGGPRRRLNIVLDSAQDSHRWVETLRTYAGCQLYFDGNEAVFVPYSPRGAGWDPDYYSVSAANIIKGSLQLSRNPTAINVVKVQYTDTTVTPWIQHNAMSVSLDVEEGDLEWREELLTMPGIHDYGQAYREAEERLAYHSLADLKVSFSLDHSGLKYAVGDVIELTHPIGLVAVPFLIETINCEGPFQWAVTACQYDDMLFSDADPDPPAPLKVGPDGPIYTPSATLTLTEVIAIVNKLPVSKIDANWTGISSPSLDKYEIQWQVAGAAAWNTDYSPTNSWRSNQTVPGLVYTVRVRAVYTDASVGGWVTKDITIIGKTTTGWVPPTPPTGSSGALYVELHWTLPNASDVSHTEVYMSATDNIATAEKIAEVAFPQDRFYLTGLAAGTCRSFWVRFIDTSGNPSAFSPNTTAGTRLCTPSADASMLSYLTGQVRESHLYQSLRETISAAAATANEVTVQVSELAQDVYGEYYVKIDANGRVAGFGIANQAGGYSQFLVVADRFAIASPDNATTLAPFVVDGGVVYLDKTSIRNADIDSAKIAKLTLTSQEIAHNQITAIGGVYNDTVLLYDSGQSTDKTWPTTRTVDTFDVVGANVYCMTIFSQFILNAEVECVTTVTIKLTGGYSDDYTVEFTDRGIQHLSWVPMFEPLEDRQPITVTLIITVTPAIYRTLDKWYEIDGEVIDYKTRIATVSTSEHGVAALTYTR